MSESSLTNSSDTRRLLSSVGRARDSFLTGAGRSYRREGSVGAVTQGISGLGTESLVRRAVLDCTSDAATGLITQRADVPVVGVSTLSAEDFCQWYVAAHVSYLCPDVHTLDQALDDLVMSEFCLVYANGQTHVDDYFEGIEAVRFHHEMDFTEEDHRLRNDVYKNYPHLRQRSSSDPDPIIVPALSAWILDAPQIRPGSVVDFRNDPDCISRHSVCDSVRLEYSVTSAVPAESDGVFERPSRSSRTQVHSKRARIREADSRTRTRLEDHTPTAARSPLDPVLGLPKESMQDKLDRMERYAVEVRDHLFPTKEKQNFATIEMFKSEQAVDFCSDFDRPVDCLDDQYEYWSKLQQPYIDYLIMEHTEVESYKEPSGKSTTNSSSSERPRSSRHDETACVPDGSSSLRLILDLSHMSLGQDPSGSPDRLTLRGSQKHSGSGEATDSLRRQVELTTQAAPVPPNFYEPSVTTTLDDQPESTINSLYMLKYIPPSERINASNNISNHKLGFTRPSLGTIVESSSPPKITVASNHQSPIMSGNMITSLTKGELTNDVSGPVDGKPIDGGNYINNTACQVVPTSHPYVKAGNTDIDGACIRTRLSPRGSGADRATGTSTDTSKGQIPCARCRWMIDRGIMKQKYSFKFCMDNHQPAASQPIDIPQGDLRQMSNVRVNEECFVRLPLKRCDDDGYCAPSDPEAEYEPDDLSGSVTDLRRRGGRETSTILNFYRSFSTDGRSGECEYRSHE